MLVVDSELESGSWCFSVAYLRRSHTDSNQVFTLLTAYDVIIVVETEGYRYNFLYFFNFNFFSAYSVNLNSAILWSIKQRNMSLDPENRLGKQRTKSGFGL